MYGGMVRLLVRTKAVNVSSGMGSFGITTDPTRPGHPNGNRPAEGHPAHPDAEGR